MGRKTEEINSNSGQRLRLLLKENHRSQKWLAEMLGYVPQHINLWINGKRHIPIEQAKKIAELFPTIRYEWILGIDDEKTAAEYAEKLLDNALDKATANLNFIKAIAKASGYDIDFYALPENEDRSEDEIGYCISKDGTTIAKCSINQMTAFISDIFDYGKFRFEKFTKECVNNG